MRSVAYGDVIFSFRDTMIVAVGRAVSQLVEEVIMSGHDNRVERESVNKTARCIPAAGKRRVNV
jgi:hypothetical protein